MKRIRALVILMLMVISLAGCYSGHGEAIGQFILLDAHYDIPGDEARLYYDKESKVMYALIPLQGMTPLYNADGSLKLYTEGEQ
jgi:hypothetical protein